jgi:predicted DNA-binding transcriptional regulator AlpA
MRLLSKASIVKRLDISKKTLARWIAEGWFPPPNVILPGGPKSSPERWYSVVVDGWSAAQKLENGTPVEPPVKSKTIGTTRDNSGQM